MNHEPRKHLDEKTAKIVEQIRQAVINLTKKYGLVEKDLVLVLDCDTYLILNTGLRCYWDQPIGLLMDHFNGLDILIDSHAKPDHVVLLPRKAEYALAMARTGLK